MADRIENYDIHEATTMGWHGKTHVRPLITLDDNYLNKWDLVPVVLEKRGQPSKYSILECNDVVGLEIGKPYNPGTFQPITNALFLELVKMSISGTQHKIVSVGSTRNRGRVFLSIELIGMEKFKAAGREFSAFLNFGNGHDKSSVLWVNTSNICTVCDNTFSMNLFSVENKAGKDDDTSVPDNIAVRQRHTKNATLKLPAIAALIDKAVGVQGEFQIEFDKLSQIKTTSHDAQSIFTGFLTRNSDAETLSTRTRNTVNTLASLFKSGRGNDGNDYSDMMSSVTDYYTHTSSRGNNPMRQVESSEYGAGLMAKQTFWNGIRDPEVVADWAASGDKLLSSV
jgi:hypothetical protein